MSPPSAAVRDRLLVCFSHLRWDFVHQRPQHLMTRAARTGPVLFLEEPMTGPVAAPRLDLRPRPGGVTVAVPILPEGLSAAAAEAAQRALLDGYLAERAGAPLVAWYYTPMALGFSDHLAPDVTVYDCMDELSAFKNAPPALMARERALFDRADLVFTGGRSLYEAKRSRHPSVHEFASSIDAPHFARARAPAADPPELAGVPRPRLGWFGVIDERMDLDLVAGVARLRPDWQFVMIGPVVKIDPAVLPRGPNVHWLGARKYEELPDHLGAWDVGLMPFALNEATRHISPTKTPEFLAAGVPVVSTAIADVVTPYGDAGLVEIATDAADMAAKAARLLERPRGPWLERVDRQLADISWDRTWARMNALVEAAARRPAAPARAAPPRPAAPTVAAPAVAAVEVARV